jgi:phosphoserine phosphatase
VKKITIAFDVDGTLISNESNGIPIANERIRTLLITLASFKNVRIVVWSGGGELYAKQACDAIGVSRYVNQFATKNHLGKDANGKHQFAPNLVPDIAIDDIQDCELGELNLIVREK